MTGGFLSREFKDDEFWIMSGKKDFFKNLKELKQLKTFHSSFKKLLPV